MNTKNFNGFAEIIKTNSDIADKKNTLFAFNSIKNEWNYPDKFLMKIAKYFKCTTTANDFLDIFDGADDINDAWEIFCTKWGAGHEIDMNPFV